jgi:hypothetical protein
MVFEAAAHSPMDWMRAGVAIRVFIPVSMGALDTAMK